MRILLVRPEASKETIGLQHLMVVEPLELEILAALKRDSDQAMLVDMLLENKPFESFVKSFNPDLVCITGYITNVGTILQYCAAIKAYRRNITTVVGGVHCEVCPDDFKSDFVDFRVVRNAAVIFTDFLNAVENGSEIPAGILKNDQEFKPEELPELDFRIPFPDRSITEGVRHRYFYIFQDKVALMKTSFGCPYTCNFCFCRSITSGQYRQRPMDEVISELKSIQEKEVYIVDDDFLTDKKRLQKFVDEVRLHKIRKEYLVYGRADFIAANPELMRELSDIGLKIVIVGFESFSEEELKSYDKKTGVEVNQTAMKILNSIGVDCFATIIVAPHWDRSDFDNMIKMVKQLGIHYINLQPLTPLPGTEMKYPEDKLIIKRSEYEKWDLAHATIRPEKLSVAEYYSEILRAYNKVLFQRKVLWNYVRNYPIKMQWKMLTGSMKVTRQYKRKIREARKEYA